MQERPSKKQRELLQFIDGFVKGNGYGPSYREIMRALDYKSVSTVAVHVDGLIARGWLRKTDNSARSLEIVSFDSSTKQKNPHIEWLKGEIAKKEKSEDSIDSEHAEILRKALGILNAT